MLENMNCVTYDLFYVMCYKCYTNGGIYRHEPVKISTSKNLDTCPLKYLGNSRLDPTLYNKIQVWPRTFLGKIAKVPRLPIVHIEIKSFRKTLGISLWIQNISPTANLSGLFPIKISLSGPWLDLGCLLHIWCGLENIAKIEVARRLLLGDAAMLVTFCIH